MNTARPAARAWYDSRADLRCPRCRDGVTAHQLEGQVVLHQEGGATYRLNSTAAAVWKACSRGRRLQDLVSAIVVRFDVKQEQVQADVEQVLAFFAAHGLVDDEVRSASD